MNPLVAAAVPSIISGIGSLFGGKKKKREQEEANRAAQAKQAEFMRTWTQRRDNERMRRSMITGLAKTYGADQLLPPGFLEQYGNFNPQAPAGPHMSKPRGGGISDFLGGFGGGMMQRAFTPVGQDQADAELAGGAAGGGPSPSPIEQGLSALFSKKRPTSPGQPTGTGTVLAPPGPDFSTMDYTKFQER